jgi:membrane protein implicated in regulation of membrane protease activity
LFAALIGTGLGPLFVGLASDGFAGAGVAEPLPLALSVVGGAAALLVALLLVAARRATRRLPQRNHQRASSERPILERR